MGFIIKLQINEFLYKVKYGYICNQKSSDLLKAKLVLRKKLRRNLSVLHLGSGI